MSEGIDGIVYLLNQAGIALARANAENARLSRELAEAREVPDVPTDSRE